MNDSFARQQRLLRQSQQLDRHLLLVGLAAAQGVSNNGVIFNTNDILSLQQPLL
jgi:hypothetical protein